MMYHEIKSLNKFAKSLGKEVAKDGGFSLQELKQYISVGNIKNMVKTHAMRRYDKFYINEDQTDQICEEIFDWLTGVSLAKLAAEDYLDCWWDQKQDCMVFKKK